jgi:hypothetical protein
VSKDIRVLALGVFVLAGSNLNAQQAPNAFSVLPTSATGNISFTTSAGNVITMQQAVPVVFSQTKVPVALTVDPGAIFNAANYSVAQSILPLSNAINASIATALSVLPLASPASGVILKTDEATGAALPVSSTLGPIFTERAETIGKNRLFIGVSHQSFHFTSLNGTSLNAIGVLDPGGFQSNITFNPGEAPLRSVPTTFNLGIDVRLAQDVAFLTYGVTNRFDVSVGLPMVHAAIASRTYNGLIYAGNGQGNPTCWCANTFTPGTQTLTLPEIGRANFSKTGFGDLLLRFKGSVIEGRNAVVALGLDLRFPTGDEQNFLGMGATSVKPFVALSLYSKPLSRNIVLAPHVNVGWQFTGKSMLGGQLQGSTQTATVPGGGTFSYVGAPFMATKDYLPDVFSWAVGTEVALGRHNTFVVDVLGNQIGWVHGIPNTVVQSIPNQFLPTDPNNPSPQQATASGMVSAGRVSFGQYNGSFGYKVRVVGNLVLTFNTLVRFDDNGLTSRVTPLYGLGYTF